MINADTYDFIAVKLNLLQGIKNIKSEAKFRLITSYVVYYSLFALPKSVRNFVLFLFNKRKIS